MHYANAELAYLTGYTHDELVGQNVQMLILRFCVRWRERRDDSNAQDPDTRIIWNDRELTVLCKTARAFS